MRTSVCQPSSLYHDNSTRPLHQRLALCPTILLPMGVGSLQKGGKGNVGRGAGSLNGAGMTKYWGSKDQGARLPESGGALAARIFAKIHQQRDQGLDDAKIWRRLWGGRGRDTRMCRYLRQEPPPQETTGTWLQAEGDKGGSDPAQERRQTRAHCTGCRYERRRLAGAGAVDAQVGGDLHQERRWGAGDMIGILR